MKRDSALVRHILLALRATDEPEITAEDLHIQLGEEGREVTYTQVSYHLAIMQDAGMVARGAIVGTWRLTWEGHDRADRINPN